MCDIDVDYNRSTLTDDGVSVFKFVNLTGDKNAERSRCDNTSIDSEPCSSGMRYNTNDTSK